jgi:lipopolysaccharide export LptBFGC system permease protein LptF
MLGTISFFLVVFFGLGQAGVGPTFLAATLTALAFQALALAVLRRSDNSSEVPLPEI